ncbi:BnaUnng02230D [Brassica napus]|uniref:RNA-dependent RNA polymerase n=1 Tax=Brassica napus TaxID=3708 RepID=A0A078JQ53_BRANA|nr:BnaUnng02230D [Brassica napus]
MISILSTLGVSDNVFEKKPKKVVDTLDSFLADHMKILHLMPLREYTKFLKDLISYGFKPSEPFLSMMLHHIRESKLVELRTKMCILIPKSRSMMGCIDETNLLEYGETKVQRALDEDLYFVSWDPELIPLKTYEPMDYTIKEPQVLDFEITIQENTKYFAN